MPTKAPIAPTTICIVCGAEAPTVRHHWASTHEVAGDGICFPCAIAIAEAAVLPPVPASVDGLIHRARTARELSQERLAASTH